MATWRGVGTAPPRSCPKIFARKPLSGEAVCTHLHAGEAGSAQVGGGGAHAFACGPARTGCTCAHVLAPGGKQDAGSTSKRLRPHVSNGRARACAQSPSRVVVRVRTRAETRMGSSAPPAGGELVLRRGVSCDRLSLGDVAADFPCASSC